MLLEVRGLTKEFGGLKAVGDFDIEVAEGEIVGLIGPNGAGKSTVFNLITGVIQPTSGTVKFRDNDITHNAPEHVAALGIGRTFQLNPLFPEFTVLENVTSSFELHPRSSLLDIFFNTRKYRRNEAFIEEKAHEILELRGHSRMKPTSWPGTWPTGIRRCWEWLGRWPPSPRSSCSTNRWRA